MSTPKVLVIGLDCAPPRLVFEEWREKLPTLNRLMQNGCFGPLRSTDPPITIPAWSAMLSGKSPAELGFYGFKNKKAGSYFEKDFVTSEAVKEKRVWDILGERGKKSVLLGIPQTYPASPIEGHMVSCFLTPSIESDCTFPKNLKEELKRVCPDYAFDIPSYRKADKKIIQDALFRMADGQLRFFHHLIQTKPWDFAMIVQIGTDRLQHCFWADWDETHPLHDKNSEFKNTMLDHYKKIDEWIQKILEPLDKEGLLILVVSDHGAKSMKGGIAINEWLIESGYLKLMNYPKERTAIEKCEIDWPHSTAWGLGGYAGRIYLNVEGREPEGRVRAEDYEKFRRKLKEEIVDIEGISGELLKTKVFTPEELYGKSPANAPDLTVYFDDLNYRSLGSVGSRKIAHLENDDGADGANHDYNGIFIACASSVKISNEPLRDLRITDVASIILKHFGIDGSESQGTAIFTAGKEGPDGAFTESQKEALEEKLRSLGYLG